MKLTLRILLIPFVLLLMTFSVIPRACMHAPNSNSGMSDMISPSIHQLLVLSYAVVAELCLT